MKKILKYALYVILVGLIIIQFINRPEKISEPFDPQNDMLEVLQVSVEMRDLLKSNCYDCHSGQPRYPWYSNVAPVSWWLEEHIEHGREELNFSKWGTYSKRRRDHKLEEMVEEVEAGAMPLPSYTWVHWGAKLDEDELEMLKKWVSAEREKIAAED